MPLQKASSLIISSQILAEQILYYYTKAKMHLKREIHLRGLFRLSMQMNKLDKMNMMTAFPKHV